MREEYFEFYDVKKILVQNVNITMPGQNSTLSFDVVITYHRLSEVCIYSLFCIRKICAYF